MTAISVVLKYESGETHIPINVLNELASVLRYDVDIQLKQKNKSRPLWSTLYLYQRYFIDINLYI